MKSWRPTWLSGSIVLLVNGVLSAELGGQEPDGGGGLLRFRREEVLTERRDGVNDGAVVRSVGRLVDVALARLPVGGSGRLKVAAKITFALSGERES